MNVRTLPVLPLAIVFVVASCNATKPTTPTSTTSNQPVTTEVACTFSLSPASAAFAAEGGSHAVTVAASPAGCAPAGWTAASNSAGLTVSPGEGSGTGTVTVAAAANGAVAQARTATIAGQTFTANVGAACTVAFTPAGSDSTGAGAGQRDVSVAVTNGPCRWTAVSSDSWITVSQTEGTVDATVRLSFAQNTGGDRTGSVTFTGPDCNPQCRSASRTVSITQQRAHVVLSLELQQGEALTGTYAGTATGPNGFTCSLRGVDQRVSCPPLTVTPGTSVTIVVTLISPVFPGARPISGTLGCDSSTQSQCSLLMNADRLVKIAVGCEIGCPGPRDPAPVAAVAARSIATKRGN
jgi:hypothetical protein